MQGSAMPWIALLLLIRYPVSYKNTDLSALDEKYSLITDSLLKISGKFLIYSVMISSWIKWFQLGYHEL